MGQDLVFGFLQMQIRTGNEHFFRPQEVLKALKDLPPEALCGVGLSNGTITRQMRKLYAHGFLEIAFIPAKRGGGFRPSYRLKPKYKYLKSPEDVSIWFKQS